MATIEWREGSPYSPTYQDIYFSRTSIEESFHIFIQGNSILKRWGELKDNEQFTIGELGFGTGLNFSTTWNYWEEFRSNRDVHLHYTSFEAHPLSIDDLQKIYTTTHPLKQVADLWLSQYGSIPLSEGFHSLTFPDQKITLTLYWGDAYQGVTQLKNNQIMAWYLDGFSPSKNPTLWSLPLMQELKSKTAEDGTFATYTVAQSVRTVLKEVGFQIYRCEGVGPKRHSLKGEIIKNDLSQNL